MWQKDGSKGANWTASSLPDSPRRQPRVLAGGSQSPSLPKALACEEFHVGIGGCLEQRAREWIPGRDAQGHGCIALARPARAISPPGGAGGAFAT